jgi:hypothetical protein
MPKATHNFGGNKAHISLPIMTLVAIEPNIATKCVVLRKQVVLKGLNPCNIWFYKDLILQPIMIQAPPPPIWWHRHP